jgi:Ca-activated chloride channel family protein
LQLALLSAAVLLAPVSNIQSQQGVNVTIVRPASGEPLFGVVKVEALIEAPAQVTRVELLLDGSLAGHLTEGPWIFEVDVGQENRDRRLVVIARTSDGAEGRAEIVSRAIKVDETVDLQLQQLYVTVMDGSGKRVLDLPPGAFEVRDEGVRQNLVTVAGGDIPFVATLIVDASGSMEGEALRMALGGVSAFVDGMAKDDAVKVVVHDDQLRLATAFEKEAAPINRALHRVEAGAGTALLDQTFSALLELERQQGRRVVVMLSDGSDLHSVIQPGELNELARLSQALIYWVRMGRGNNASALGAGGGRGSKYVALSSWRDAAGFKRQEEQLEKIVRRSGGRVYELESIRQVGAAFGEVLRELREQYALGYYPQTQRNDGSWREVKVSLARSGLRLRVREGYVDR